MPDSEPAAGASPTADGIGVELVAPPWIELDDRIPSSAGFITTTGLLDDTDNSGGEAMFHRNRVWQVFQVATPEELAHKLIHNTYCLNHGFVVAANPDYLFLNYSMTTLPDRFTEYAVVKGGLNARERRQIESITISWCTEKRLLHLIRSILAGRRDNNSFSHPCAPTLEARNAHDRCSCCG